MLRGYSFFGINARGLAVLCERAGNTPELSAATHGVPGLYQSILRLTYLGTVAVRNGQGKHVWGYRQYASASSPMSVFTSIRFFRLTN